jgi:hypothetical protein
LLVVVVVVGCLVIACLVVWLLVIGCWLWLFVICFYFHYFLQK